MSLTQKKIAEVAGVSLIQVNRALNDHPLVAAATRQRVLAVAQELGYAATTNLQARQMAARRHSRRTRSGVLAVLLPAAAATMRDNHYHGPILSGLEEQVVKLGQEMIMATYPLYAQPELGLPRMIREGDVDAVICLNYEEPVFEYLAAKRIPTVVVATGTPLAHVVRPDDAAGIAAAVQHLYDLGHRRLGYLAPCGKRSSFTERLRGFQEKTGALALDSEPVISLWGSEAGLMDYSWVAEETAKLFHHAEITGLVCYNDGIAMHAIQSLQALGLDVPGKVSVTGFDNVSAAHGFSPQVSSAGGHLEAMGRRAAVLADEVAGLPVDELGQQRSLVIATRFYANESTSEPCGA